MLDLVVLHWVQNSVVPVEERVLRSGDQVWVVDDLLWTGDINLVADDGLWSGDWARDVNSNGVSSLL